MASFITIDGRAPLAIFIKLRSSILTSKTEDFTQSPFLIETSTSAVPISRESMSKEILFFTSSCLMFLISNKSGRSVFTSMLKFSSFSVPPNP